MLAILYALAALATSVLAFPRGVPVRCNVQHVDIPLPANQSQLVNPNTTTLSFIGVGVGVQNYTCGSTGTYT